MQFTQSSSSRNGSNGSVSAPPVTEFPKLWADSRQRRKYEDLADFFAIIKVTEHLEKAYARDAISEDQYAKECNKLLAQFKETEKALKKDSTITDTEAFMTEFQMDCPRAHERLIRSGVPATTLHNTSTDTPLVAIAETTQMIITAMDACRLDQRAVDEIQPLISDVMSSITKVPNLPANFDGVGKIRGWLETLNRMRADEEIDEGQSRQLVFDLESLYSSFHRWLGQGGKK